MAELIRILESLVSLSAPTVVLVQQLLCTTLTPLPKENPYWRFHEAEAASCFDGSVDYREPASAASTTQPFLVLKPRTEGILLSDFRARYGEPRITDVSVHHPAFVGYTFTIHGRPVSVNADTKSGAIRAISIDYSSPLAEGPAPGAPAGSESH